MDWQKIVIDLVSLGMTQAEIAEKIGVSQPTISDLKNGNIKEPLHSKGCALIGLHKRMLSRINRVSSPGASAL